MLRRPADPRGRAPTRRPGSTAAFRLALARPPRPAEVDGPLGARWRKHERAVPAATPPRPASSWASARRRRPRDLDPAELAAWTSVARVLLNLHETITRN